MPFDVATETPEIRVAMLCEALRAPMPEGFKWDFSIAHKQTSCGTVGCAMGLATEMWPLEEFTISGIILLGASRFFGIDETDFGLIFCEASSYNVKRMEDVTPAMVADKLEEASRRARGA